MQNEARHLRMGDEQPNTFGVKLRKRADGGEHKKRSPKGNDEKAKAEAEAQARADSEAGAGGSLSHGRLGLRVHVPAGPAHCPW